MVGGGSGYYQYRSHQVLHLILMVLMQILVKMIPTYSSSVKPMRRITSVPNRTVNVPEGRSIFLPIINWISILHIDGETDHQLIEIATKRMD